MRPAEADCDAAPITTKKNSQNRIDFLTPQIQKCKISENLQGLLPYFMSVFVKNFDGFVACRRPQRYTQPMLKLAPPYEVIAYLDDEGVIRYEPHFKKGPYPAFKRWHKRAMEARDKLLAESSE